MIIIHFELNYKQQCNHKPCGLKSFFIYLFIRQNFILYKSSTEINFTS